MNTSHSLNLWERRSDSGKIVYCSDFAARKHKDQRRKDGMTPYINHPLGVAKILMDEGGVEDVNIIQAAILHDTLEDTDTSVEELELEFGPVVTSIVVEVSDDQSLPSAQRKLIQTAEAEGKSPAAKQVRMADKLYNLRDLNRQLPNGWTEERRLAYFVWAESVVIGMYGANEKLGQVLKSIFIQHKSKQGE